MNDSVFETVEKSSQVLKLDFSSIEFARLAEEQEFSEEQIQAVGRVFEHLQRKKIETTIHTLLFDLIDRRYNKEGNFNIVFTSNKHPSHWRSNFNEDDALLCALDRIFDDATVFNIKGESFRGKCLETVALQTSRVKAPTSSETPTP